MGCATIRIVVTGLAFIAAVTLTAPGNADGRLIVLAQAMILPLEALGIEGGHLVSLDMSPGTTALPADATVRIALSRS